MTPRNQILLSIALIGFVIGLSIGWLARWLDRRCSPDVNIILVAPTNSTAIERRPSDLPMSISRASHEEVKTDTLTDAEKLLSAVRWNDETALQKVLADGADPNARDHQGNTPLMVACIWGDSRTNVVTLLLGYDADVHATNNHGDNAVDHLRSNNPHETLEKLLRGEPHYATSRWDEKEQ